MKNRQYYPVCFVIYSQISLSPAGLEVLRQELVADRTGSHVASGFACTGGQNGDIRAVNAPAWRNHRLSSNPLFPRLVRLFPIMLSLGFATARLVAQSPGGQHSTASKAAAVPRVVVPAGSRPAAPVASARQSSPSVLGRYPWRLHITTTLFWIGEQPSANNPVPNYKSSWDGSWMANYGGYDDPNPGNRIANHLTGEFRPKAFVPKLNPFYVALPYNDVISSSSHKPEAARVIPWFARLRPEPGESVCKGQWVEIYNGRRSCFAQWEDCGPWETDDWEYVFGDKPPKNKSNGGAAIDLSPAIRDYLELASGKRVHWRFVEATDVPYGPWKKYGQQVSVPSRSAAVNPGQRPPDNADLETQRRYMEYLRKMRDEEYLKKPLSGS